jgi:hypothetical protein
MKRANITLIDGRAAGEGGPSQGLVSSGRDRLWHADALAVLRPHLLAGMVVLFCLSSAMSADSQASLFPVPMCRGESLINFVADARF